MSVYEGWSNDPGPLRYAAAGPILVLGQVTTAGNSTAPSVFAAASLLGRQQAGVVSVDSPLSALRAVGGQHQGLMAIAPLLGDARVVGNARAGAADITSPLGAPSVVAWHDYAAAIAGVDSLYVMDITDEPGTVTRVPISSWQGTLSTENQSYVQCVVPAVNDDLVAIINAGVTFSISRVAHPASGVSFEQLIVQAPLQTRAFAQGAINHTATLSGYADPVPANADPDPVTDRVLTQINTSFIYDTSSRVRCSIDWLLRPAQRAFFNGTPMLVTSISYYVGNQQAYMDVSGA